MDELLKQIAHADEAGMYLLALMGALSLPDIAAALQSPDGRTNRKRYERW